MASFLRPRRGKKATATSTLTGTAALKRGEVFFEVPTGGVGTGKGAIKMGDGSTDYASLPYFLSMDDSPVAFTNSTAAETTINNTALLTAMAPTASLATVLTKVKQLLHNYNSQITQLNNDFDDYTKYHTAQLVGAQQTTISIGPSGYTVAELSIDNIYIIIAVATWATNSLSVIVYNVFFANSGSPTIRIAMRNTTTSTITVTVTASALCKLKES